MMEVTGKEDYQNSTNGDLETGAGSYISVETGEPTDSSVSQPNCEFF